MTWMVVAASLLLLWGREPALAQPLPSPTQHPLAGSRVFGAKGCLTCHAVNGVGATIGPDLGRLSRPRSFEEFASALWNHPQGMAERLRQLGIDRPHLDRRETGDLIAFLFTLDYFDPPGHVESGRRLFVGKKCVVCHQVTGTGGVVGPSLDFLKQRGSPIFVAAAMWNHGPAMAQAMRAQGIERPRLEDSELRDLMAYLKSVSPAPTEEPLHLLPGSAKEGRRLFVEKRCIACHSVGGQGGRAAPDLADRGAPRSLIQFAAAMWNKAPAMMEAMELQRIPVPQLRAEDMADLVAYLDAVRHFTGPGDPRKGWTVMARKGCLDCHSVRGEGGKAARDLAQVRDLDSLAAVISALWNHAFLRERTERRTGAWPRFRSEEMADLLAFLQSLRRAR